jgi:FixJ family two-component response regulator
MAWSPPALERRLWLVEQAGDYDTTRFHHSRDGTLGGTREREVLDLLVAGKSNKEIARALGTSPRTIDVHRARVFQKLEAKSLPELVHLVLAARVP